MEDKKTLTIVVACYNEEQNVEPLVDTIFKVTDSKLANYHTEIMFIDNDSKDHTRDKLRIICSKNKKVKAIFNAKNFGHIRSPYHALTCATGDLVMLMCADFQDPPELIPEFVKKWEEGYKVVVGVKTKSKTNPFINCIRKLYYHIIKRISDVDQIENFTGFGLYDQSFIKVLASLEDPYPYMRGIVAELGPDRTVVEYTQPERRAGKTKNNFWTLYDMAMVGITSYSKFFLRIATFVGGFLNVISVLGFITYMVFLILGLTNVFSYNISILYPILIAIFWVGSIILFFIGMMGEYILQINTRVMKRPLVVEQERINFIDEK